MQPTTVWHLFNLRENPFFQTRLGSGSAARPLSLFVGRTAESERILRTIFGASDSRQTLAGPPGYGKTTLAEHVKSECAKQGFLSRDRPVGVSSLDDADSLLVSMLRYVYETVVGDAASVLEHPAVVEARLLVQTYQRREGGVSASAGGVGFGASQATRTERASFDLPREAAPDLIQRLVAVAAAELGRAGVLLHLNNLENLAGAGIENAARSLRDIRDVFLTPRLHTLMVGTPEAIGPIVNAYPQMRSIFAMTRPLPPLGLAEVHALLTKRYLHLRLDESADYRTPVEPAAVNELYPLFNGDLRQFLRALELACVERLGYTDDPRAPLALDDITTVLAPLYLEEATQALTETNLGYLEDLVASDQPTLSQAELKDRWNVSQPAVSNILSQLQNAGYVREAGRENRRVQYALTAPARLAFTPRKP